MDTGPTLAFTERCLLGFLDAAEALSLPIFLLAFEKDCEAGRQLLRKGPIQSYGLEQELKELFRGPRWVPVGLIPRNRTSSAYAAGSASLFFQLTAVLAREQALLKTPCFAATCCRNRHQEDGQVQGRCVLHCYCCR